ncbi:hypothetical protein COCSADRAFT_288730 [Bipolaris sorokiniana ND90Pr]|uniref:Uncharacterized protein n=1 Tax=Cochliobolus sativus (strain ND90Pr / ATCC 201652) TaxID=665912 RepID=M2TF42_COCSN|nr:uncharacterized protein COCSADRAFT_288730 [Bipolaris sorokiniana ND90Pr]EMD67367.1 hypothetical protein COCSADRAFT_288730 [Bipolaris sorokiniana ND90Pr]
MPLRIRRLETGFILISAIHAMPSTGHYPLGPPALFADMPYSQPMPPHRHARDASIRPSKRRELPVPHVPTWRVWLLLLERVVCVLRRAPDDFCVTAMSLEGGLVDRSCAALWLHPTRAMFQVPGGVSTRRAGCMSAT